MSLNHGQRVRINGLQKQVELNNCTGVIVPAANEDEERQLLTGGRMKVVTSNPAGNIVSVKIKFENLTPFDEPVIWAFVALDNSKALDLMDVIKKSSYGKNDISGDIFVDELQKTLYTTVEGKQLLPKEKELLFKDAYSTISNNETFQSKARLFQSYARGKIVSDPKSAVIGRGYSCAEWISKNATLTKYKRTPDENFKASEAFRLAKGYFGSGKVLTHSELLKFLETVRTLQDQADEVAVAVMAKLPSLLEDMTEMTAWAQYIQGNGGVLTEESTADGSLAVYSNNTYLYQEVPRFRVVIPKRLVEKFSKTYKEVTGQIPSGLVYIRTAQLRHYIYTKAILKDKTTTTPQTSEVMGWTFTKLVVNFIPPPFTSVPYVPPKAPPASQTKSAGTKSASSQQKTASAASAGKTAKTSSQQKPAVAKPTSSQRNVPPRPGKGGEADNDDEDDEPPPLIDSDEDSEDGDYDDDGNTGGVPGMVDDDDDD